MTKPAVFLAILAICNLTAGARSAVAQSETAPTERSLQHLEVRAEVDGLEEGALFQTLGVGMFAASAGDLASTEWGLGRPGVYEANPLASNRTVRLSTHVLVPAAVWWTTRRLHRDGHEKTALWIRIAVTAAYGYAVMHNLRTAGSPPVR